MRIGAHLRGGGGFLPALERAEVIGAEVVQLFTQSPRAWKPSQYAPEVLATFREARAGHPTLGAVYCHATYLINLATADPELLAKSRRCLAANLQVARGMGASGLVLHVGSHKGAGLADALAQVVDVLLEALAAGQPTDGVLPDLVAVAHAGAAGQAQEVACPILLENAAGAGGTVGRSFDELAAVLDRADAGAALGVCLDTQHLWASGVGFATLTDADRVVADFDATIGLDRLACLHLNDSKVPFGANRDRHENPGEGTIGLDGLGCLLGHPALRGVDAILEVPGEGDGPRAEDLAAARQALARGQARRRRARHR